jgi:chromosome segregation ATPase
MSAAHEPSMDEILRSIRRIIRNDKDEDEQQISAPIVQTRRQVAPEGDDNLIMMKIGDQNRLRILEKKLQTIEREYEQKLASQRQQAVEYYRKNNELTAAVAEYKSSINEFKTNINEYKKSISEYKSSIDDYKTKLSSLAAELRLAHSCLEKLQTKNKQLKEEAKKTSKDYSGYFVLQSLKHEIDHRYNPANVQGDRLAKMVREQVYNEFNKILLSIRDRLRSGNFRA